MFSPKRLLSLVVLATLTLAQDDNVNFMFPSVPGERIATAVTTNDTLPVNYGFIVFPSFQALDVFGPLDALNILSLNYHTNLAVIAETLDPVSTKPRSAAMNPYNSSFGESIVPTHTFSSPPPNLDVLMIPGGLGTRAPDLNNTINFIRDTYPNLKYLITVCTGAWLAARAGVLDGKNATTNKAAWAQGTRLGKGTHWIAKARWVKDGNIYTTSGVSAGIDGTLQFIEDIYGKEMADKLSRGMEYDRHTDSHWDPWADYYNITDVYT